MNVLVDTNVWMDIILKRQDHFDASARAVSLLGRAEHAPFVSAHAVTTIFYLVAKNRDDSVARQAVAALLERAKVAEVDGAVLRDGLAADFSDYEDAVVDQAAVHASLDAIVTRNVIDFGASRLAVYTPEELAAALTV